MHETYHSPAQLAALLGVSESTVKRWVDRGGVGVMRTAGGHRRIPAREALRMLRAGGGADPDLAALRALGAVRPGPRGALDPGAVTPAEWAELLRRGGVPLARWVLTERHARGHSFQELGDGLIGPAMAHVGERWAAGEIDVFEEHLVSQRCWSVALSLRDALAAPAESAPLAVGGAPPGDPYLVPVALAELALLEIGWRVMNLGPDLPMASLAEAIRQARPALVWLSVTTPRSPAEFAREYQVVRDAARGLGAAVALGGQGVTTDLKGAIVGAGFGSKLAHLCALAEALTARLPTAPAPPGGRPARPARARRGSPRSAGG